MFHAAAVLLRHRDNAAPTITGLIGTVGQFAEDLRLQADYGVSYQDLAEAAATLREETRTFIDFGGSVVTE